MQLRINLNTVALMLVITLISSILGCQTTEYSASSKTAGLVVQDPLAKHGKPIDNVQVSESERCGVLIMAHGGSESWNRAVEQVVLPLREVYPIEIAFGMAKTSTIRSAVERLRQHGVDRIAVVRMFISGESFLEDTQYILGIRNLPKGRDPHGSNQKHESMMSEGKPESMEHKMNMDTSNTGGGHMMEPPAPINSDAEFILSTNGVAASSLIDEILVDRVKSLSLKPPVESILILAHGPGNDAENQRWLADMRRRADRLQALGPFVDIKCETLREDWPGRRADAEKRIREYIQTQKSEGGRVIVIPFRVAGFGPYGDVLEGLDYVADERGFCPHPAMTIWIDQTAREFLPELPFVKIDYRSVRAN